MKAFRWTALCLGTSTAWVGSAFAGGVLCDSLPNPIYIQSGDTQEPLLKNLGRALADSDANPMTVVYLTAGSCVNIEAMYEGTPITQNMKYVPSSLENPGWEPGLPSPTCTVPLEGVPIDVAVSALFVSACDPTDPPEGVALFQGPVQAYVFIVPEAGAERAITAEEAYFVFGFGAAGEVEPWSDETFFFIRPQTKSTILTLAAAIGVPATQEVSIKAG